MRTCSSSGGGVVGRKPWLRMMCLAIAVALVAGACGSSRGDDSSGGGDDNAASTTSSTAKQGDKFGDLASPCGPGDAKGATAKGVTDTQIVIAYGDDKGFSI